MRTLSAGEPAPRCGAWITLLAVLVMAAAACGGSTESATDPLSGSRWEMTWVWDGATLVGANPTTIATIVFTDGTAGGFTGCNHYQAEYSIERGLVAFDDYALTGSACDPTYTAQGSAFVRALQASAKFSVGADTLELTDDSGSAVLRFRPARQLSLVGIVWRLAWYGAGSAPLDGSVISLTLSPDGSLSGSAGCNEYFADYDVDEDGLMIGQVASTERACLEPDGIMSQETEYLNVLRAASGFTTSLTGLELLDDEGATVAEYRFGGRIR